jgi:hypothetical protein
MMSTALGSSKPLSNPRLTRCGFLSLTLADTHHSSPAAAAQLSDINSHRCFHPTPIAGRDGDCRALVFGTILVAVAVAAGFHTQISSSLAAARDAKAATFSERFATVLNQMKKLVDAVVTG